MREHPIQPLVDVNGTLRFQENCLVRMLLDHGQKTGLGLNELARKEASPADRRQLAQLIGYSLDGYGGLGYVTDVEFRVASEMHKQGVSEDRARVLALEIELAELRAAINTLREPMARLFDMHPEDLGASDA